MEDEISKLLAEGLSEVGKAKPPKANKADGTVDPKPDPVPNDKTGKPVAVKEEVETEVDKNVETPTRGFMDMFDNIMAESYEEDEYADGEMGEMSPEGEEVVAPEEDVTIPASLLADIQSILSEIGSYTTDYTDSAEEEIPVEEAKTVNVPAAGMDIKQDAITGKTVTVKTDRVKGSKYDKGGAKKTTVSGKSKPDPKAIPPVKKPTETVPNKKSVSDPLFDC